MYNKIQQLLKAKKFKVKLDNVYCTYDENGRVNYSIGYQLIPKQPNVSLT